MGVPSPGGNFQNIAQPLLVVVAYALSLQGWLQNFSEVPFLPGTLIKRLMEVGVCGGKYSEKVCYDLAESLFGYDDADFNMVRKYKTIRMHICLDIFQNVQSSSPSSS